MLHSTALPALAAAYALAA